MARVGDFLIAVVLIAVTLPLMVIVALAIKLDSPGPVLSKREQWGPQGRKFQLFSFRTESLALQGSVGSGTGLPSLQSARFFAGRESTACRSSSMCCAAT